MKKIFGLLYFVLHYQFAVGQLNDSINYHVQYGGTGIFNKTNDGNTYNINNHAKFSMSKKSAFVTASGSWIYGEQSDETGYTLTNNDISSVVDFNLYKTLNNFYYWGLGGYDKSYSLKIDHRLQAGVGVGYNVLNKANLVVVLSDGLIYENSDLYDLESYEILRNSFRLKYRFVYKSYIVIDGTNMLQNSLAKREDYIIKSVTNASVKLYKILSFTTSVTYNKLNITSKETLLINFGLTLDKYF